MPILRPSRTKLLVPLPGPGPRRYLHEQGEELVIDHHWRRAIARGDVVLVEPAPPAAAPVKQHLEDAEPRGQRGRKLEH